MLATAVVKQSPDSAAGDVARSDIVKAYSIAVAEFLRNANISVQTPQLATKDIVKANATQHMNEWAKKGVAPERWSPFFNTAVDIAITAYGHTGVDVQVHVAVYTILTLCVDDLVVSEEALDGFSARLLNGAPQLDPILECLVDNLRHMSDYYPSYASKYIISSTIEFVDSTLFDKYSIGIPLHQGALPFVDFRRLRNGLGSAYGFFIWDKFSFPDIYTHVQMIPEATKYLNFVNDILSFYKEELAGEKDNYVHSRALVTGKNVIAALQDVIDETLTAINRARGILGGNKEKDVWESFMRGYAAFHYMTARYKLAEILDGNDMP